MYRLKNKILASIALFSVELIVVWIVFLGSLIVFLFISKEIFYAKQEEFDKKVFEGLIHLINPSFTSFMKFITSFASMQFVIVISGFIFVYFSFIKRHRWYSIKIPVVAIGSITLNILLKNFFNRPRPLLPHLTEAFGHSFPSGHAMVSFSFYGLLIYIVWRTVENKWVKWLTILGLFILIHLIGFSRVYLRVHYASDVMAGFALGAIWLILSIFILRKIEKFSARDIGTE